MRPDRRRTSAALLLAALGLGGCAAIMRPRRIVLGPDELTRLFERAAPLDLRVLELLDLRVSRPRVALLPERNRLATEMDVRLSEPMTAKSVSGSLAMDCALRYDEAGQAVRMTQVQVQRLHLNDVPAAWQPLVDRIGRVIAGNLLEGMVLYRLTPQDLGRGLQPRSVTVTPQGVEIIL